MIVIDLGRLAMLSFVEVIHPEIFIMLFAMVKIEMSTEVPPFDAIERRRVHVADVTSLTFKMQSLSLVLLLAGLMVSLHVFQLFVLVLTIEAEVCVGVIPGLAQCLEVGLH